MYSCCNFLYRIYTVIHLYASSVKQVKRGLLGVCQRRTSSDVVLVPSRETCVICMENFRPGEVLEVLLCQHIYHVR